MQMVAAAMMRSPRQAPSGASARPAESASAAPATAISTPRVLRRVSASRPNSAATIIVVSGSTDSASEPRAAVVKLIAML